MGATFAPYSNVATRFDDSWFYVESSGIPAHDMMVNITAWIAQVPLPQPYVGDNAWSIPLAPAYADSPISIETDLQRGAIGIAANGIPIFNPLNASGLISKQIGELDDFGGHSGRADDYHYHTAPLHLEATSGTKPIAFAFDGFAVYGSTPMARRWSLSTSTTDMKPAMDRTTITELTPIRTWWRRCAAR